MIPRKRLSLPQNDNLSSISSACFSNSNRDSIVLVSELTAFVFPPIKMELKRLLLLLFIPFFDTGSLAGSGGGGGGGVLCCTTAPSPRLCNRLSIDFVVIINIEKRFEEAYYHKINRHERALTFLPFRVSLVCRFLNSRRIRCGILERIKVRAIVNSEWFVHRFKVHIMGRFKYG